MAIGGGENVTWTEKFIRKHEEDLSKEVALTQGMKSAEIGKLGRILIRGGLRWGR